MSKLHAATWQAQSALAHLTAIDTPNLKLSANKLEGRQVCLLQFLSPKKTDNNAAPPLSDLQTAAAQGGITLPESPNTVCDSETPVFWRSPNEWVMVCTKETIKELKQQLLAKSLTSRAIMTEIAHRSCALDIEGENANTLLAEGCGIDFNDKNFKPGFYKQTAVFAMPVIIHKTSDTPSYTLYLDRSLAPHLWHWLASAYIDHG